jgi:hypothetical protein
MLELLVAMSTAYKSFCTYVSRALVLVSASLMKYTDHWTFSTWPDSSLSTTRAVLTTWVGCCKVE